jgi:hypothetical protein
MLVPEDSGGEPLDRRVRAPMEVGKTGDFVTGIAAAVMARRSNGSLHTDHAYVGANMIGIGRHAQGVRSRADSLAFVPGTAYEDYGTGGCGRPVVRSGKFGWCFGPVPA